MSEERGGVSLREYLHAEIAAVEQLSQARFDVMQRAVDKALEATERRFEGVNEFRATLSDQADEPGSNPGSTMSLRRRDFQPGRGHAGEHA